MADWILVPCLVALRNEFNRVSPGRDKGSDGSIGDRAHALTPSDHNPDESGRTPYSDADYVDEVHAIDIDKSGPWPSSGWFDDAVETIRLRHLRGDDNRLQNIIWRGRIASRSWGWGWQKYSGKNGHYEHAHFSARYTTAQENDTRPWGVLEDDMTPAQYLALLNDDKVAARVKQLAGQGVHNQTLGASDTTIGLALHTILARSAGDDFDEDAVVAGVLAGLGQQPVEATVAALRAALGSRAAEVGRALAGN